MDSSSLSPDSENDENKLRISNLTIPKTESECGSAIKEFYESYNAASRNLCPIIWDNITCWLSSEAGNLVIQPCFEYLNGLHYDGSQNASKLCYENGTWSKTNYSNCLELHPPEDHLIKVLNMMYLVGYSISIVSLLIATNILIYFRDLRNRRNYIHTNLMWTYILMGSMWIFNTEYGHEFIEKPFECATLHILYFYFQLTNYFWMFIEGLYLFLLVVRPLAGEFTLKIFMIIGWGVPFLINSIWATAKYLHSNAIIQIEKEKKSENVNLKNCPLMIPYLNLDLIRDIPIISILFLNFIFLIVVMRVLLMKLRTANSEENQQYWKAAKALLILTPLLGVTYVIFFYTPQIKYAHIIDCIRSMLFSIQGLFTALLYCFTNSEVRRSLKHHCYNWREDRRIGRDQRMKYRDESQEGTESLRLHGRHRIFSKDISTSVATTTTTVFSTNSSTTFFSKFKKKNSSKYRQPKVIINSNSIDIPDNKENIIS